MPTHKTPGPLVIREGRYYRDRNGDKHGPAKPTGDIVFPWALKGTLVTGRGSFYSDGAGSCWDMISEVDAKPATRRLSGKGWAVVDVNEMYRGYEDISPALCASRKRARLIKKAYGGRIIAINWSQA